MGHKGWAGSRRRAGPPTDSGGVMAEVALDAVRRELREFPAAVRGEWVQPGCGALALNAEQPQDVGGPVGMPGPESRAPWFFLGLCPEGAS